MSGESKDALRKRSPAVNQQHFRAIELAMSSHPRILKPFYTTAFGQNTRETLALLVKANLLGPPW